MKARLPQGYGSNGMNPNNMMKQVQKMQADMQAAQEELEQKEYTSVVGGGAVEITMTGKKSVTSVKIKPEVVDPDDVEMLEDLIVAAVNDVISKVENDSSETMQQITGSMPNIPGLF
ncbi:MAG: YbaB/EbfC family nucleoid-associated protein [Oscillospiraceae bacterium]|nr:YbaB/EbfC family nucleoid-associated protein [Oscillospiraceae bacterium]